MTTFVSSFPLLRRLYTDYIRAHFAILVIAIFCMAVAAMAVAANAWLMEPILDDILIANNEKMLILGPIAVVGVALIKGIAEYSRHVLTGLVGQRIVRDIRQDMFARLMQADMAFYTTSSSGRLLSRFTHDVPRLETVAAKAVTGIIKDGLTVFCLVIVMFVQDWRLACIAIFAFPLAILPIVRIGRSIRKVSLTGQQETASFTSLLGEVFQNAREVKTYGAQRYEQARARAMAERLLSLGVKNARVTALSRPLMEILSSVMIASVVVYGGSQVISGTTTPGAFTSFITACLLAYQPMKSLANLNIVLQDGLAAAQRVFALLDKQPQIKEKPHALPLPPRRGRGLPIELEAVSFSYRAKNTRVPALKDVSLRIAAGKTVALVGPSGSGKSTLINLIPRFYDAGDGTVRVDGHDVRDLRIDDLRANIALVSQETGLFDETVAQNIAYGKPGASSTDIAAAAKEAAADSFIRALPQGYDTHIGERGVRLSGGQKQRLSIARAFLKDAPILLLDEATSALDSESERHIQSALDKLKKGRTTLVIAHQLATVHRADTIIVLDGGRIVERGTHEKLWANKGLYAKLCQMQFRDPSQNKRAEAPAPRTGETKETDETDETNETDNVSQPIPA